MNREKAGIQCEKGAPFSAGNGLSGYLYAGQMYTGSHTGENAVRKYIVLMKPVYQRILVLTGFFVIASLFSGYVVYQTYTRFNEQLLQQTALLLGEAVEETLLNAADQNLEELTASEKQRIRELMRSMTTESGSIIHILLINSKMTILLSSDPDIEGHAYKNPEEIARLQTDQPIVLGKNWEGNFRIVDVIIPLKNAKEEVFSHLRLVLSYRELSTFFRDISTVFIPLILIFSLLMLVSVYFLSKSYRKPLDFVKKLGKQLSSGNYDINVSYPRDDEFTQATQEIKKTIKKAHVLQESYKKIEKRISALLQAVDESTVLIDAEENITTYNNAAVTLLECPEDQDFPAYFRKLKTDNRELRKIISQALLGNDVPPGLELSVFLPNGKDLLLRITTQILFEEKRINGVLLTFKDIYLLNELEHNLQRSMKFGVIANLASSISHEIRNPLSSVAMHAEGLKGRLKKSSLKPNDPAYHSLDILQKEVNRLHRIIDQFLNLARSRETILVQLRINALINDVIVLVQQQAVERNITIEKELDDTIDFIYGDADQIKQVILNIVLNAFQAIENDGRVTFRSRASNERILVEIHDNGKGISPEARGHLFELYYTTKEDGSGIGLAISRNIMQAHDGRITFESAEGKGTVFILDFPRKDLTITPTQLTRRRRPK